MSNKTYDPYVDWRTKYGGKIGTTLLKRRGLDLNLLFVPGYSVYK